MRRARSRLLAGGLAGSLAGLVWWRRRSRPDLSELVQKADAWVNDTDLPPYVRDVARRMLDLGASAPPRRRFVRRRR